MLDEHLPLATFTQSVPGRCQHQLSAGQEQAEQDLVWQYGPLDVAGAQTKAHRGSVGRDQAQPPPARHQAIAFGALNQPIVEAGDGAQRQLGAGLCKGLSGHMANQLSLLLQVRKKHIEFGLKAHAHAAQQQRHQSGQRQLALPGKCFWVRRMTGLQEKFGGLHVRGEVGKDRSKRHGSR